jgi:hypothetical protein
LIPHTSFFFTLHTTHIPLDALYLFYTLSPTLDSVHFTFLTPLFFTLFYKKITMRKFYYGKKKQKIVKKKYLPIFLC